MGSWVIHVFESDDGEVITNKQKLPMDTDFDFMEMEAALKTENIPYNPVCLLADCVEHLSDGLCTLGAGPYGIGIDNDNRSTIGLVIRETPRFFPVEESDVQPEESVLTIEAYHKNDDSVVSEKEASEIMRRKQNDETEQVASAFLTLAKIELHVLKEDYEEAFSAFADRSLDNSLQQSQMM